MAVTAKTEEDASKRYGKPESEQKPSSGTKKAFDAEGMEATPDGRFLPYDRNQKQK